MSISGESFLLEISRNDKWLSMSLAESREPPSTLKHYNQCPIVPEEVNRLCQEMALLLGRAESAKETGAMRRLEKTAQLLWAHLFSRQVKERLKDAFHSTLIFSLDEELINIPWELLHDGRDFLCLRFSLGRLVRTRQQPANPQYRDLPCRLKMLILADPTADLKSAYREGQEIKNQFDKKRSQVSIDFKSTQIDSFYLKKNLRDYDIVHFAGHCEYDSLNPSHSGWVLSDGRFNAASILRMGEEGMFFPSLIFSNACHSAQVPSATPDEKLQDATYSFACSFLFAGVRHYIGTIRRLRDDVGVVFAKEFYQQLINGCPVGESLRLARLGVVKEFGLDSGCWADYLLYGDPGFSFFPARQRKPSAFRAKRIKLPKGRLLKIIGATAAFFLLVVYLYIRLPALNPTSYSGFLKSRSLLQQGKNKEAIVAAEEVIRKEPLFLGVYPLAAQAAERLGRIDDSLRYYFAYSLNSQKKHDKKALSRAYLGIGWAYYLQADYPRAEEFLRHAIEISRQNNDQEGEVVGLRKLAVWHIDKEEYNQALELLVRSSEINRRRKHILAHRVHLACDYFDMALVFENKEDFATARDFYQKSRRLFEQVKLKGELSDYYFNLGEMYLFEKQYQQALDCYRRGLEIDQRHNNLLSLAADFNMLGELYFEMDNLTEAERYFNQAVSLSQEIGLAKELAAAYYNLGLLCQKRQQKGKAIINLRQAQEIYARINPLEYQRLKEEILSLNEE